VFFDSSSFKLNLLSFVSQALQLICNISIDFRLWDTTLWENVLQRLLKHGSVGSFSFAIHR